MKMNLVLLPSPYLINDQEFPNLGVLYLSAVLKQNNYNVSVIDLHGYIDNWQKELIRHIDINETNIFGISCVTPELPTAIRVLKEIKSIDHLSHITIGGPMATCDPQRCLSVGFDQVVVGEGEIAILKIMEGNRDKILKEPLIQNLDEIPFPDRSAIDIHRYHYEIDNKISTSMITTRGCFWSKCRFCCQTWNKKIRYRSLDNVIKEIDVIHNMDFNGIMIVDDEFFSNKKRDFQICKKLKELDMEYRCLTRPDLITENVAEVAAKNNCRQILLGFESGSERILKTLNKGMTKEQYKDAIKTLKDNNIKIKALFMIGLPGESHETIDETMQFIEETGPDMCEFTIYTPYPNSDFWNNSSNYDIYFDKDNILTHGAWYKGKMGEYISHVSTSFLTSEEIIERRDKLERRFRTK